MSNKISISDCHAGRIVLEESVPFSSEAHFNTGSYLRSIDSLRRFAPASRTALVEWFRLENVIIDGQTGALFKDEIHVAESRYSTSLTHHFAVDPSRITKCSDNRPAFIAFHAWHNNYYHWLTQCIPSMYWALKVSKGGETLFALPTLNAWQEQIMSLTGMSQVERYAIDHRQQYEVGQAVYTTFTQGVTTYRPSRAAVDAFRWMRSRMPRAVGSPDAIIYISREDRINRRTMVNEAELCALLKAEGVEIIVPTHHSIEQQVVIFAGARVIIGPHGAGLANIIFCEPGVTVYELMSDRNPNPCFANLAHSLGMNYWAEAFPGRLVEEDREEWAVDLQEVLKTVRRLVDIPLREPS